MRDIKRIDKFTDTLNKLWKEYPDLRFWQLFSLLLENTPDNLKGTDPFFWEETVWQKMLEDTIYKN